MKDTNSDVLKAMELMGGGFAKALSLAWQKADLTNQRKLMRSFEDLYKEYEMMVPTLKDLGRI